MQIAALEKQRQFVYDQLAPGTVGPEAKAQDIQNAQDRLALQAQIDPALFASRYGAESKIQQQLGALGPGSNADVISTLAAEQAKKGVPGMEEGKKQLVDAALKELSAGATLPPDVQAELVKAGLEKSGMVTGSASPKGFGGQMIRQLIGQAGLQLQQQRQERATNLLTGAQNLEQSRQQLLTQLFPNLANTQLNTLAGTQNVLTQSNQLMAPAGLTGNDVANLWLARVGATTQLAQQQANAAYQGGVGSAAAMQQGFASALPYIVKGGSAAGNSLFNSPSTYNGVNQNADGSWG